MLNTPNQQLCSNHSTHLWSQLAPYTPEATQSFLDLAKIIEEKIITWGHLKDVEDEYLVVEHLALARILETYRDLGNNMVRATFQRRIQRMVDWDLIQTRTVFLRRQAKRIGANPKSLEKLQTFIEILEEKVI